MPFLNTWLRDGLLWQLQSEGCSNCSQAVKGRLVRNEDHDGLATEILRLLRRPDEGRNLAAAARNYVRRFHSRANWANQLTAIYERLSKGEKPWRLSHHRLCQKRFETRSQAFLSSCFVLSGWCVASNQCWRARRSYLKRSVRHSVSSLGRLVFRRAARSI